jgi:hypothetical protein
MQQSTQGQYPSEICIRHYPTSQQFVCSRPYEVNEFLSIYIIFLAALGPGVYSASDKNEYQ